MRVLLNCCLQITC